MDNISVVDSNTPLCVLLETADAYGITYQATDRDSTYFVSQLCDAISQTEIIDLPTDLSNSQSLRIAARFVNKYAAWTMRQLTTAYNFLLEFNTSNDPLQILRNHDMKEFAVGLQTPDKLCALNARVLYKICLYHNVHVNVHSTINHMCNAVILLQTDTSSLLRRTEVLLQSNLSRKELINILSLASNIVRDPQETQSGTGTVYKPRDASFNLSVDHDQLKISHASLNNIKILQQKIDPVTDAGAVALAAINYGLDISQANNVVREYKILRTTGKQQYVPSDTWLKYWYQQNSSFFDLNLTFNPLFATNFYSEITMRNLLHREGYTETDIRNHGGMYELLQLVYVSETFHLGALPNMKSQQTKINLDDVKDIPYGQLLCYGALSEQVEPITVEELTRLFTISMNYPNPFAEDSIFSHIAINKLRYIIYHNEGPNVDVKISSETKQLRLALGKAIDVVENSMKMHDEATRNLINISRRGESNAITLFLTNILHLGMYMRGWKGEGPYAVETIPKDDVFASIKVTEQIVAYETLCASNRKIADVVNRLPLVDYRNGKYYFANNRDDGYTIGDRLAIVKAGERSMSTVNFRNNRPDENINSCIRISSNWFCSSAYKYLTAIGLPAPFDIMKLKYAR